MLSAWGHVEWRKGSIGIYGFDIVVDSDLQPWLIEVNKSPCFAYSTHVTQHLVPRFMEDMVKVMVDYEKDKECDTGELELILEQPYIKETQEIRPAEEFTVVGKHMTTAKDIKNKKK